MTIMTLGQPIEHRRQLTDDLRVERGEPLAELRTSERGDTDLREEHATVAIGRKLDEEEIESARESALRVEHVELGAQRRAQIFDHLIDRRDEEIFLGHEIVVDQAGGNAGFCGDALDGRLRDAVFQDRRPQAVDDLTAPWSSKARATHR